MKEYSQEDMGRLLRQAGIELSPGPLSQLWHYHKLLRKANPTLNLTRIHNFEKMVRKHYIDSLFVHKILSSKNLNTPSPILDIGSGAGLPGIPLAICLPQLEFILAESRKQRSDFLEESVCSLGLKNVRVHKHSISRTACPSVGGAITRALEKMSYTLKRLEQGLCESGLVIFMKGPGCGPELEEAEKEEGLFQLVLNHPYSLPHSDDQRRLVVWKKNKQAPFVSIPKDSNLSAIPLGNGIENGIENYIENDIQACIQSRTNPRFRFVYNLRHSRYIKKYSQSLICGKKLAKEYLQKTPQTAQAFICPESLADKDTLFFDYNLPRIIFTRELFRELDFMGTGPPLLLFQTALLPLWESQESQESNKKSTIPLTLFLPLGNPENLGAALRNCAAFPVESIVLLEEACHPFHPRAIRAAAGHCFHLPLYQGPAVSNLCSSAAFLKSEKNSKKSTLFALDTKGQSLSQFKPPKKMELILGSEGQGLPPQLDCPRISIPTEKRVESINAAVALGIALYTLSEQMKKSS